MLTLEHDSNTTLVKVKYWTNKTDFAKNLKFKYNSC